MTTLVCDLETDGLLPDFTRIWVLVTKNPVTGERRTYADQPGYTPLAEGMATLKAADRVVFHNAMGFDLWVVLRLFPGTLRFEQIWDTLVVSRLLDPDVRQHSLDDLGQRIKAKVAKVSHDEWDRFSEEMVNRCETDCDLGTEIYRWLFARVYRGETTSTAVDLEHKVAMVISMQTQHGFRLDKTKAEALEGDLRQEHADIELALQNEFPPWWVPVEKAGSAEFTPKSGKPTGKGPYVAGAPLTRVEYQEFNPGSRKQIEERLRKVYGWKPTKRTPSGSAKLDEDVLDHLAVLFPTLKNLARYFRVGKMLGQLSDGSNSWLKLGVPDGDGFLRIHGSINPNGARTRRMSHFKPNMGQVDKKEPRMREVWVADDGEDLVGVDAEGLELRMLGHYLFQLDGGAFIKSAIEGDKDAGTDPHSLNMKIIGLYKRDNAKTVIYALIYGGGDGKLGMIIIEDAREANQPRPAGAPSTLGKAARAKLETGITGFGKLVSFCKSRFKTQGYLTTLDGGRLKLPSDHSALNTLLQGGGAIVMKMALAIFHFEEAVAAGFVSSDFFSTKGFSYCANVHDEVQLSAKPEVSREVGDLFAKCITLAGERLGLNCPLAGSVDVGANWKETH